MSEPFIGTVMIFAPTFAPRGWQFCQGQLLSIAQNSALFALVGTTYGGNGQTTFALPNLASRVPVGTGQGPGLSQRVLGQVFGTESVTMTQANLPAHTHTATVTPGSVSVSMQASTTQATTDTPAAGSFLADASVSGLSQPSRIYTPSTDTGAKVPLGGVSASMTGPGVVIGITGNNTPISVLQPSLAINFCIALEGVFPSRD